MTIVFRILDRCEIALSDGMSVPHPNPTLAPAVSQAEDKCWLWTGPTSGKGRGGGYGRFRLPDSGPSGTYAVHIAMWEIFNGPMPRGKTLDHTCTNRLCCNPKHLDLVTNKTNCKRRDRRLREATQRAI